MNLKNKKIFYTCFLICFILYLIFANTIVLKITGKNSPKALEDISQLEVNSIVYSNVDYLNATDNLTLDFSCNGWVFAYSEEDNSAKNVSAVFKGKNVDKSYILPSVGLWHKQRLTKTFSELKNEENAGFGFDMSALKMKNGIYELMLYDVENEKVKGLARTGVNLIKDSSGFRQYFSGEISNFNMENAVLEEDMYASLNIYDNKDDKFLLYGWAGIKGKSLLFQNVYLRITDENGVEKYYDSASMTHEKAAEYLKEESFFYSGFQSFANKDFFVPNTNYKIDVILDIDGEWFYNSIGEYYCESSNSIVKVKK